MEEEVSANLIARRLAADVHAGVYRPGEMLPSERDLCERFSAGRNKETGENYKPRLELVRLTIPRRVNTQEHMDVTVDAVNEVVRRRDEVKGLRFTYEPEMLRFFQARFEQINPQE